MWDEEKAHLAKFNQLVPKYKARPSALLPFWNIAGFALGQFVVFRLDSLTFFLWAGGANLGAGSALLGKEAAMACTVAVESVIGEHYNK